MSGNIPYVDRLRQQLVDAGRRRPAPPRFVWATAKVGRVVVAALLLVGVAVPLFALRGLGSRSLSRTGAGASSGEPPITGHLVTTTTKLQPGTLTLTVAFGDVWVVRVGDATSNPPAGLVRLNGTTGTVEATIPVNTVKRLEEHALVTAAGGLVWVSEGIGNGPQTISAVDPATNAVAKTVTVPAPIEGLAAFQGELWASVSPDGVTGSLVEIDPASARVVNIVPIGVTGPLSVAGDSLWIHYNGYAGTSVQLDPATGARGIKLDGTIGDVVLAGGLYWSIVTDDPANPEATSIEAIDPATGKTVVMLPAPRVGELLASSVGLWVWSGPGSLPDDSWDPNEPATVSLIDPAAQAFVGSPVPVDNPPSSFAVGDDALWITQYETGNVTKVTLQT